MQDEPTPGGAGDEQPEQNRLEDTERWFIERGIPHFIEDYRAREDILTRAAPVMLLVCLLSTMFVFRENWTGWTQAYVVAGTFAGLVLLWVVVNLLLGRRPFAVPTRVTRLEVALVLLIPPLVAFVVGGHPIGALVLFGVQTTLLALIYFGASYGILPILRWTGLQVVHQVGDVMRVLTRALPLLLLFATFLFTTTELWQIAQHMPPPAFAGVLALFAIVAVVFVAFWLDDELDEVGIQLEAGEIRELVADTPMEGRAEGARMAPLTRRQRANLLLVLVISQIVQAVMVGVAVFGFFLIFGWLTVGHDVQVAWMGKADPAYLFKVAGLIAGFSALYFAVYAVTDGTYRAQFFAPIRRQMDKAIAVRAAYLSVRG